MIRALAQAIICIFLASAAAAQTSREAAVFGRALDAMRSGDWGVALALAEGVSPVARDVVEWHRLRAGQGSFDDTRAFLARRGDWPGLSLLRQRSEDAVPFGTRPEDVVAFFAAEGPQTGHGALSLIAALRSLGKHQQAEAEAIRAWREELFSEADETVLLGWYAKLLAPLHEARLDMLLWRDVRDGAERMYPRVTEGRRALARARLALRANANGVDTLVAAVPNALQTDPGLLFERMQWRARKGRNDGAVELMLAASPENLGQPERWAGWRRVLARAEMRAGNGKTAYRLAAGHGLTSGSDFADLEWLAGYIALTYRSDAKTALEHFRRFRGAVDTPISLGRAGYWEGRAFEALGDAENARLAYAFGAEYQTGFYGLLAAEKAGLPLDPELMGRTAAPDWREMAFAKSSVFEAGRLFLAAGEIDLAERFLTHLAESLSEPEVRSLGNYAISIGEPHLAVMIGKRAASFGITIPAAYFAVADLGLADLPVPRELALAIARRESEFDPAVVSGVGARGLMQIMPATAKEVAGQLGLPYSRDRLLTDPAYNARLGTAYLDTLMELFDGNPVMVAAGYNAGPSRPASWMAERGDPRRGRVDIVDWIEHIPFDETRDYVMRVTESLPIYRARLTGKTGPVTFSRELVSAPGHMRMAEKAEIGVARPRLRPHPLTD